MKSPIYVLCCLPCLLMGCDGSVQAAEPVLEAETEAESETEAEAETDSEAIGQASRTRTPLGVAESEAEAESEADSETTAIRIPVTGPFLGQSDRAQRRALANQPIAEIEKGRGGRSLAFKITLEDGTVGYYKPEQSFSAAHWYAELASYYLDRELGLGRVIPAVGRRMEWAPLRAAAGGDERIAEVTVAEDGTVRGAFIWWVPGGLRPIDPGDDWERWVRVEGPAVVNPYQRPREWSRDNGRGSSGESDAGPRRAPDLPERPGELSDMILFDYLTTNVDRWGGNFTNVRTRGVGGPLVYLDNGAGFTPGPAARIPLMDARLHTLTRFRPTTVEAIRNLDFERLEQRMRRDPLGPILNDRQWSQLRERHAHLLEHVAEVRAAHGSAAEL